MGQFQVKETNFRTPPEDTYWLDLVWIDENPEGKFGPNYNWHWMVSDVEAQKEWAGCRATSQTPIQPTVQNRFGEFLHALLGKLQVDMTGSTEDLVMAKFRVKGFIEHNKVKRQSGEESIFCNVKKLIEGSSKKGEGIGYHGVSERLKPKVNVFLQSKGLPLLKIEEQGQPQPQSQGAKPTSETASVPLQEANVPKREEIPWVFVGPMVSGLLASGIIC